MKKFWMMLLAAASLAGCQKSEEVLISTGNTISLTAEMSQPTTSRTALVENEGVYSAIWKSGDKLTLFELANETFSLYESNALGTDAETASFTFDGVAAMEAESFRYVAGTNITSNCTINNIRMELPAEQAPATMNTFDGAADVLLSLPIDRATQPVSEALTFTTTRVSAVVKLAIKNMTLADGEKVEQVVFSCEEPISGNFQVNVKNLTADTYPIPFSWREEGYSISITLPEAQSGDFVTYFSTLPATLKAGESYTVTVKTNQKYIIKEGTLVADLALTAGDITTVSVNMSDAATKSKVENLSEEYEYAIGYTTAEGVTYLLDRTGTTKNPVGAEISSLGLSLSSMGSLIGEVSKLYRWKFAPASDGKVSFYYQTNSGNVFHLTAGNKNQGIAIQKQNDEGKYVSGAYYSDGVEYFDAFTVEPKEGGYYMNVAGARYLDYVVDQNRFIGNTKEGTSGVVNFYRIQPAPQKTIYPVITKAADITEGTYVLLCKVAATGNYFAMKNEMTLSAPAAIPAAEVSLSIENGGVTAANVADAYKWTLVKIADGKINIKPAVDHARFLREKNNAGGFAIVTNEEYEAAKEAGTISGVYESKWTFVDNASYGLQAFAGSNERYMGVNETSLLWAGYKTSGFCGGLVLVKISDSTEQIVTE